jgi:phage baseplate assembly protein W
VGSVDEYEICGTAVDILMRDRVLRAVMEHEPRIVVAAYARVLGVS